MKNSNIDYSLQYSYWHNLSKLDLDNVINTYKNKYNYIVKNINKDSVVVEMGCGAGYGLEFLKSNNFKNVYGYDIDKSQVKECRKRKLKVLKTDKVNDLIKKYSIKKYSVSLVLALDIIEHMSKEESIRNLSYIYKYMSKGGCLILTTPNANSVIANRYRYDDITHKVIYTEHSVTVLLRSAGFSKITVKDDDQDKSFFSIKSRVELLSWLTKRISRTIYKLIYISELGFKEGNQVPLSPNILVIATKT
jgi:2-polyprenyl-3-methyl-5-hydroxy-6-metoxy-1,4-benzoquinol methylase